MRAGKASMLRFPIRGFLPDRPPHTLRIRRVGPGIVLPSGCTHHSPWERHYLNLPCGQDTTKQRRGSESHICLNLTENISRDVVTRPNTCRPHSTTIWGSHKLTLLTLTLAVNRAYRLTHYTINNRIPYTWIESSTHFWPEFPHNILTKKKTLTSSYIHFFHHVSFIPKVSSCKGAHVNKVCVRIFQSFRRVLGCWHVFHLQVLRLKIELTHGYRLRTDIEVPRKGGRKAIKIRGGDTKYVWAAKNTRCTRINM